MAERLKELQAVFPNVDPESLEVVLNMVGGEVDKAATFIFDIMQQQEGGAGEVDLPEPGPSRAPLNPHYISMNEAELPANIRRVVRQSSWFAQLPYIAATADLEKALPILQREYAGEFHCGLTFDPPFLAKLIRHGYLTMAEKLGPDLHVLLPKMHSKRCILQWGALHVEKNVCKRCKRYEMTVWDFTLVANEPGNGADPRKPFTEEEVRAMAVQLDEDEVIMFVESKGSIYPLE